MKLHNSWRWHSLSSTPGFLNMPGHYIVIVVQQLRFMSIAFPLKRQYGICNIPALPPKSGILGETAKGDHCLVKEFESQDERPWWLSMALILNSRALLADEVSSILTTCLWGCHSLWQDKIGSLKIKASRKDRQQYYNHSQSVSWHFSNTKANRIMCIRCVLSRDKTFKWDGNERISSIVVLWNDLKLPGKLSLPW